MKNDSSTFFCRIAAIATIALLLVSLFSATAKGRKDSGERDRDRRKADYIFLEGSRQNQLGNADAYFEFLSRAHQLNPDDKFVGKEYGFSKLRLAQDSATIAEGYALMEDYIKENPEDFYGNVLFAALSSRMGKHDNAIETWRRLNDGNPGRPEIIERYAEALTAAGEEKYLEQAMALYDTLETSEGMSIELISERIRLDLMREDTAAVLGDVRRLVASSPTMVEYNVFAGDIYNHLGESDSALFFYDKALEIDPGSGLAYYAKARYYQSQGDSASYEREVLRALEQEDLDVPSKIEILRSFTAEYYSDSLQQPRIREMFDMLVELHPHEADIHSLYRDFLIAIEDYPGAAEQASYALDIDPSDDRQWVALGSLYLQTNEMEKAYEASERGLHFFPDNEVLYLFAGTALTQLERYDDAMEQLRRGLEATSDGTPEVSSNIYTSIGDLYYKMNQTDSAFASYNKAIELDPENVTALNNCAYYLACEDRDLDKALDMITTAIEERPDEPTYLDTYAWVLFKRKDYEKAKEAIEAAFDNEHEPSSELYEHAGDIYFMLREPAKALEMWKKALELDPDSDILKRKVQHKTYFYE